MGFEIEEVVEEGHFVVESCVEVRDYAGGIQSLVRFGGAVAQQKGTGGGVEMGQRFVVGLEEFAENTLGLDLPEVVFFARTLDFYGCCS